ncbi:hypothetical protein [Streptomyces sp. DSM 40750]|uniref:hypothetical protein n=1 Tax=Streptomyces sp. DSM 40750 TaxID=2801030 RepID=UPI00214D0B7A|nr:hypothetical protein [Streptomyces sp. DSM 40750]UUU21693.1 hypothetical protein JIX55_15925 [Streptomyces sp. DSM 40750]
MPVLGRPVRPILVVLARNFEEFRFWCRDSGLRENDPEVVFASRFSKLRGISYERVKVIRLRGWGQHPEGREMDAFLCAMEDRAATSAPAISAQIHVQPDPPHVAEAIRDIRRRA